MKLVDIIKMQDKLGLPLGTILHYGLDAAKSHGNEFGLYQAKAVSIKTTTQGPRSLVTYELNVYGTDYECI